MQRKELKVVSYNVWRNNLPKNRTRLAEFIANCDVDIVCLQEVTRGFYYTLRANEKVTAKYDFSMTEEFAKAQTKFFEDELILVKKEHQATLTGHTALRNSKEKRCLSHGMIVINGVRIAIGTAHLESKFFKPEFTAIKTGQLAQAMQTLEQDKPDCAILAVDSNFTGGDQLQAENQAIESLKLNDVWKSLHPDMIENETNPDFQNNHVTWDGANKPNVKYNEFHRPDRVFMKFFKPVNLKPNSIERIKSDMSDHYGLQAEFSFVN